MDHICLNELSVMEHLANLLIISLPIWPSLECHMLTSILTLLEDVINEKTTIIIIRIIKFNI